MNNKLIAKRVKNYFKKWSRLTNDIDILMLAHNMNLTCEFTVEELDVIKGFSKKLRDLIGYTSNGKPVEAEESIRISENLARHKDIDKIANFIVNWDGKMVVA